jgi:hypothetical protein
MLMVMPPLTVRDFRIWLNYEVADEGELLGNYAFNISQGILQRVSRFIDALAFVEEDAESGRGGVMGFGHKRNVLNLEKAPARRVAWDHSRRRSASRRTRWRRRRRPRRRQRRLLSRRRSRTRRWLLSRGESRGDAGACRTLRPPTALADVCKAAQQGEDGVRGAEPATASRFGI